MSACGGLWFDMRNSSVIRVGQPGLADLSFLKCHMLSSNSGLALGAAPRNAANMLARAAACVAIAALWLCPIGLFLGALWNDGRPFSMVKSVAGMSVAMLALFLPAGYYRPKHFELSGRFYECLGVRWFKRWTPDGDHVVRYIRHFLPDYKVITGRCSLGGLDMRTRRSEQGHLLWLLVTATPILYALVCGWAVLASWLFLGNLVINVYPIMVQRYNRARVQRSLARGKPA